MTSLLTILRAIRGLARQALQGPKHRFDHRHPIDAIQTSDGEQQCDRIQHPVSKRLIVHVAAEIFLGYSSAGRDGQSRSQARWHPQRYMPTLTSLC